MSRLVLEPSQPSIQLAHAALFPGVKQWEHDETDHSSSPNAEV